MTGEPLFTIEEEHLPLGCVYSIDLSRFKVACLTDHHICLFLDWPASVFPQWTQRSLLFSTNILESQADKLESPT